MRHGQINLWPGLPAPVGGWHPGGIIRHWLGLSVVAGCLLLAAAGCGSGANEAVSTVPPCSDSQCLTPTPDPGAAVGALPSPPAVHAVASPATTASPVADGASQNEAQAGEQLAFQAEPAALGPVEWATEIDPETHEPRQRVDSFSTNAPVIYGVVAVDRIAAGTTVQAQWTYNRTRLDTFDQSLVVESASTNTWLEFHLALSQPGAWPSGQYDLNILINGEPAVSGSVNVFAGP